jgi:heat shock protein HtpX
MYEQIARNKRRTVVYIGVFMAIWLAIGSLLGWLTAAGSGASVTRDVVTGTIIAGLLALAGVAFTLQSGTKLVLAFSGATPADPARYPAIYDLVAALAMGDGLPAPAIYIVDDPSPNAFATGISPEHAAITVTTGLLAVMDREELEGVLGHEMSHIKNYDTRLLLIITTLIGMAGLLASILWRSAFFVRGRGRDGNQLTILIIAAGALLAIVGFVLGPLVRLALSHRREALADASSVELTRNPAGLLRALRTLQANDQPLARTNHATAAMCIDDPLQHHEGAIHRLFDTHPPIAERIAILGQMVQGSTV